MNADELRAESTHLNAEISSLRAAVQASESKLEASLVREASFALNLFEARAALEEAQRLAVANGTGWDESIQIGKQAVDKCESIATERDEVTVRYLAERQRCDTLRDQLSKAQAKITAARTFMLDRHSRMHRESIDAVLAILEGEKLI